MRASSWHISFMACILSEASDMFLYCSAFHKMKFILFSAMYSTTPIGKKLLSLPLLPKKLSGSSFSGKKSMSTINPRLMASEAFLLQALIPALSLS